MHTIGNGMTVHTPVRHEQMHISAKLGLCQLCYALHRRQGLHHIWGLGKGHHEHHVMHESALKHAMPCCAVPAWAQDPSQSSTAGAAGRSADGEQGQDLQKLLKLYKEEREQLSKDVLYYKQSCKDLKRRLKAEVCSLSSTRLLLC